MTTWVAVDDSQTTTWDNAATLGYLLLESGVGNYLIQETGTTLNRFLIVSSNPTTTWNTIDDSQSAVWASINPGSSVTWTSINDTQGAVWTPVSTT